MKKTLPALVLISFLTVLAIPMVASAVITEAPETCILKYDFTGIDSACYEGAEVDITDYGMCCLLNTIYGIVDWVFVILVGIASIFVILGAFVLLTAAGTPEKITSGRNYILYAAIGLAIAFLAKAIPSVVKLLMGIPL